jgi:hypothetical protein
VDSSLSVSGGLNKSSGSETIAIWRMESTTVTKSISSLLWRRSKE